MVVFFREFAKIAISPSLIPSWHTLHQRCWGLLGCSVWLIILFVGVNGIHYRKGIHPFFATHS